MTKRRTFIVAIAGGLLVGRHATYAQPQPSPRRIGYLDSGSAAGDAPYVKAFRQGLHDQGWIEGQNIAIEFRYAEGKFDRLPTLADELVRSNVDLIFATTTPAALAAKRATTTIPIVIGFVADPVGSGLVASFARPGGNVTGWTHQGLDLRGKYLELLKEAVPDATRFAVLWNPANPVHVASLSHLEAAAKALEVQLYMVGLKDSNEIESVFSGLANDRVEALAVLPDGMFLAQGKRIIALAARNRLPTMYGITDLANAGGLMAYGVNFADMFRRGASFVDKILKGAKPADLPVERPTKIDLVVNLKTAKALGISIPESVLLRADEVIR